MIMNRWIELNGLKSLVFSNIWRRFLFLLFPFFLARQQDVERRMTQFSLDSHTLYDDLVTRLSQTTWNVLLASIKLVSWCLLARKTRASAITFISAYDDRYSCDCSGCWASWTPCDITRRLRCSGAESAAALCAALEWASWRESCRTRRTCSKFLVVAGYRVTGATVASRESPKADLRFAWSHRHISIFLDREKYVVWMEMPLKT